MSDRVTKAQFWEAFDVVSVKHTHGTQNPASLRTRSDAMNTITKFVDQQEDVEDKPLSCNCIHSGRCRYESVILSNGEDCRHKV